MPRRRAVHKIVHGIVAGLALLSGPAFVSGQQPPQQTRQQPPSQQAPDELRRAVQQQTGRPVSQAEILERIRQSGLTRAQVRARLQAAGYDPSLADRYFDVLERGGEPPRGDAAPEFMETLGRIGIGGGYDPRRSAQPEEPDEALRREMERDSLLAEYEAETTRMEVFGLRTFRRAGTQFQPLQYGPVDADYRIGPGDQITLVLTGDVEEGYALDVTRDGHIFIPDVGQLQVSGMTLAQLDAALFQRLSRVYSGVSRSPGATTRFQVSLGKVRTNQVFVRGEVALPGSYQVSGVAGLFTALYQAGGPTEYGSFRRVQVHRNNGVAYEADLYEFLVGGNATHDIRLQQGDHIFVPPAGPQIRVEGSVRRPAIYEMLPGEGLTHLLTFAGGLRADAHVRRIQIDRVLPPHEQQPGHYRTLLDVELSALAGDEPRTALVDGDVVHVFAVGAERRNRIWLSGEVRNPGVYEWRPGATLWSTLTRADGVGERAYTQRAHIYRMVEKDGTRRLIQASLEQDEAGRPLHDLPLADNDSIVILSYGDLRTPEVVAIDGFVKHPDSYPLARGMTLVDLILAAGGFVDGAYVLEAEVTRQPDPLQRTNTTAHIMRIPLQGQGGSGSGNGGAMTAWAAEADGVELRHGDRVFIRRAPGYETLQQVKVTGHVMVPGTYVLAKRDERLAEVLERAGGLTPEAYTRGIHVVRRGHVVAGDLSRAVRNPRDRNNIQLEDGDSIYVPALDPTVTVTGAVSFEARVLHVPGRSLDYYIQQAGGFADNADRRRIAVAYANGERSSVRRSVWGGAAPPVEPGSEIFVPARPSSSGFNWDQVINRGAALLSATATILIAVRQF